MFHSHIGRSSSLTSGHDHGWPWWVRRQLILLYTSFLFCDINIDIKEYTWSVFLAGCCKGPLSQAVSCFLFYPRFISELFCVLSRYCLIVFGYFRISRISSWLLWFGCLLTGKTHCLWNDQCVDGDVRPNSLVLALDTESVSGQNSSPTHTLTHIVFTAIFSR